MDMSTACQPWPRTCPDERSKPIGWSRKLEIKQLMKKRLLECCIATKCSVAIWTWVLWIHLGCGLQTPVWPNIVVHCVWSNPLDWQKFEKMITVQLSSRKRRVKFMFKQKTKQEQKELARVKEFWVWQNLRRLIWMTKTLRSFMLRSYASCPHGSPYTTHFLLIALA